MLTAEIKLGKLSRETTRSNCKEWKEVLKDNQFDKFPSSKPANYKKFICKMAHYRRF